MTVKAMSATDLAGEERSIANALAACLRQIGHVPGVKLTDHPTALMNGVYHRY